MAWPFSRLTTYVASSTPSIKAYDLNAIQDAIAGLFAGFGFFGDGSDGAESLDGVVVAPSWASLASGVYSLNRDIFLSDLTLTSTAQIHGNGFRIFVNGTLTIGASAKVQCNGNAGVTTTQGSVGNTNTIAAGASGGVGGINGTNPNPGGSVGSQSLGGAGGAGGDANGSVFDTGEAGGTVTAPTAIMGGTRSLWTLQTGHIIGISGGVSTSYYLRGGAGGGGGGSGYDGVSFTDNGGGGGAGAGVLLVCARRIVLNGVIEANGGAGGDNSVQSGTPTFGAGGGGGGGGGGGVVLLLTAGIEGSGTVTASGGVGGAGRVASGAENGDNGSDGTVIMVDVSSGL